MEVFDATPGWVSNGLCWCVGFVVLLSGCFLEVVGVGGFVVGGLLFVWFPVGKALFSVRGAARPPGTPASAGRMLSPDALSRARRARLSGRRARPRAPEYVELVDPDNAAARAKSELTREGRCCLVAAGGIGRPRRLIDKRGRPLRVRRSRPGLIPAATSFAQQFQSRPGHPGTRERPLGVMPRRCLKSISTNKKKKANDH